MTGIFRYKILLLKVAVQVKNNYISITLQNYFVKYK